MESWMDAHCHLTRRFHPRPLPEVLQELADAGCGGFVLGGVDPLDWQEQLEIPDQPLRVHRVFGLHPWTVQEKAEAQLQLDFAELEKLLPKAQGLGECGLDYFRCKTETERQKQILWFERQLNLAVRQDKPCVLHIVRAHHEALRMMKPFHGKIRGLVHSFWANTQTAQSWLDLGFMLSLHPRIHKGDTHGLLDYIPADRVLFESDSPEVFADGSASDPRACLAIMEGISVARGSDLTGMIRQQNQSLALLFA